MRPHGPVKGRPSRSPSGTEPVPSALPGRIRALRYDQVGFAEARDFANIALGESNRRAASARILAEDRLKAVNDQLEQRIKEFALVSPER
jgi:hypothetical protein